MPNHPHYAVSNSLIAIAQRLRALHPDMTLMQLQALMIVARDPGITQRALMQQLEAVDSTASRTIGLLAEFGSRTTPGLKLVRMEVNPDDRRERNSYLTKKGETLLNDIIKDLKQ